MEFGVAGSVISSAVLTGLPWPVVLVLALSAFFVYGWRVHLRHRENMKALDRTTRDKVADVMGSITGRRVRSTGRGLSKTSRDEEPD
jgi:membrane protein implicated in regulation of membrane protease activity